MRFGDIRVSTTEQNLSSQRDHLKPATDVSVDVTEELNTSLNSKLSAVHM